jgi:plasmid stability protein
MKTLTVRGVDDMLAKKLKKTAQEQGKSVNQVVLSTLEEHLGTKKRKRFTVTYQDMDHLFGRWSEEEFQQIQGKIDSERTIDEELWS